MDEIFLNYLLVMKSDLIFSANFSRLHIRRKGIVGHDARFALHVVVNYCPTGDICGISDG